MVKKKKKKKKIYGKVNVICNRAQVFQNKGQSLSLMLICSWWKLNAMEWDEGAYNN